MHKVFDLPELGLTAEIGKLARQADGAVWIKAGDNVVLATVVASKKDQDYLGFFPLTVEYRERFSSVGKIPGGFVKREGKLSDNEVLTSRLIDRPIRPLFPQEFFNEVQLLCTVYSFDGKFPVNVLALIGASLALTISEIPFLGPVGAVHACKIDGKWKFNAPYSEASDADSDIMIAGTQAGICMVEGHCNNVPESELIDLLFSAHEEIKKQIQWQLDIQKELGVKKAELNNSIDLAGWKKKIKDVLATDYLNPLFSTSKKASYAAFEALENKVVETFESQIKSEEISKTIILSLLDAIVKDELPQEIVKRSKRLDGRALDQVRNIMSEISVLPCAHGSSVFQRGETQALASIILGTGQDAQKTETLLGGLGERSFMLHYNFPPFATGEVKPIRGAGRREIGHGYLAESSFLNVLPSQEQFPYTIRSVVDILESNGSSSMASVCSTSLGLMDAGVPLKSHISGVAMGALRDADGNMHVLTDITGKEDGFGLMDFKVTGTESGIMAFQLDIKDKVGLPRQLMEKALEQARIARIHILCEMAKTLVKPKQLSDLAPRVISFKVPQDKIGAIIGPAGKIIKEIIAKTTTQIDISDDGTVKIYSKDSTAAGRAECWIRIIAGDVKVGSVFTGIIKRVADFGVFVELVPGKEGLIHISTINRQKQNDLYKICKINEPLQVKVVAYDSDTDRIRLVSPELE
ncbi:MAG: Polyribonucleotide nucleotidyltransferase [candidate division TM6 bacterium GW2011_GWF2_37_49]|nr:MAG: Polyribonucleotide nucleotidyltransferase [candidate division TM6 bacterium GW2011_GWF2_37_49]